MSDGIHIDVVNARRLTERIRLVAGNIADNVTKLRDLVAEAKEANVHELLGYPSWTAYLVDVFGDEPLRLARDVRQELVAELSAQGLSTRAIAPLVGVDRKTIERDISGGANVPPAPPSVPEPTQPSAANPMADPDTGEILEAGDQETSDHVTEAPSVRTVTGLDGKTYTSAPTERRRPFFADVQKAGWELRKAIERLERLETDDRFTKNKAENWAALQPHLDLATETLTRLRDRLT